ncbi:hypothetical protein KIPB_001496 [Kipferlia bialata]|uniref:Tyrosine-protein kinase ephrin type A/B receptor-like domain-containing protein n=1 Tax=Kipferlia bialata TaxID=797122 RepID=A0A9K3CP31_9EUKA|nr:hypothetical protein KIPB_001496 [Kipferlia bialata]|eukprot:g1496.t1
MRTLAPLGPLALVLVAICVLAVLLPAVDARGVSFKHAKHAKSKSVGTTGIVTQTKEAPTLAEGESGIVWEAVPENGAPPARRYANALLKDDVRERLIVFGGTDTINFYSDLWFFDIPTQIWQKAAVLGAEPPGRAAPVAFLDGDNIYVGFGFQYLTPKDDTFYSDMWMLNQEEMIWNEVTTDVSQRSNVFYAPVEHPDWGNCLLMFGGMVGDSVLRDTYLFEPSSDGGTFHSIDTTEATTPPACSNGCAVSTGNTVYMHGGYGGLTNEGEELVNIETFRFRIEENGDMDWTCVWSVPEDTTGVQVPPGVTDQCCYLDEAGENLQVVFGWLSWSDADWMTDLYSLYLDPTDSNPSSVVWTKQDADLDNEDSDDVVYARDSALMITDQGRGIVFGGWGEEIDNDLLYVSAHDPSTPGAIAVDEIHSAYDGVPALVSVAHATSGDSIYGFGGQTDYNDALNTFFGFNTTSSTWFTPSASGDLPPSRYDAMMESFGPVLVLFGGQDATGGFLDDMYVYHTSTTLMKLLETTGTPPSARSSAATTTVGETLFLHGGLTSAGVDGDLFMINYIDKIWTPLTSLETEGCSPVLRTSHNMVFMPDPNSDPEETSTYSLSDGDLYVLSGLDESMWPVNGIFKAVIDLDAETVCWQHVDDPDDVAPAYAAAPAAVIGSRVLSTGGSGTEMRSEPGIIKVADFAPGPDTPSLTELALEGDTMERNRMSYMTGMAGTQLITLGGYLVNTATSPQGKKVPSVWVTDLSPICTGDGSDDEGCYPCTKGTVYSSETGQCEACAAGSYAAQDGLSECTACPMGFYNPYTHAESRIFCFACPSGTYNDEIGQAECKTCWDGYTCPVASITPSESDSDTDTVVSVTPEPLEVDQDKVDRYLKLLYIILGGICASGLLVLICGKTHLIKKIDLFALNYVFTVPATLGSKTTWIGGFFSAVFICSFVVMGSGLVIPYLYTNISEDRGLVPLCLASTVLTGNMTVDMAFTGQFDDCALIADGEYGTCSSDVTVTVPSDINTGGVYTQTCMQSSLASGTADTTACAVRVEIQDALLSSRESEFSLQILGSGEYFASAIDWEVSSNASNPGQISSIGGTLLPYTGMTFRGTTTPTEIGLFSTESMYDIEYEDEGEDNPSTGRIFEFIGYERGTMVSNVDFHDENGVSVTFILERSENVLSWSRSIVQNPAAFAAAILGSYTGLQGMFGSGVGYVRTVWGWAKGRWGKEKLQKKLARVHTKSSREQVPAGPGYINPLGVVPTATV